MKVTDTEQKALALVNEVAADALIWVIDDVKGGVVWETLCLAIEQHEQFKREVSKAITDLTYIQHQYTFARGEVLGHLEKFVLKEPADPLVEAMRDACGAQGMATKHTPVELTEHLRAALAKRGLKIVETSHDA